MHSFPIGIILGIYIQRESNPIEKNMEGSDEMIKTRFKMMIKEHSKFEANGFSSPYFPSAHHQALHLIPIGKIDHKPSLSS